MIARTDDYRTRAGRSQNINRFGVKCRTDRQGLHASGASGNSRHVTRSGTPAVTVAVH